MPSLFKLTKSKQNLIACQLQQFLVNDFIYNLHILNVNANDPTIMQMSILSDQTYELER